MELVARAQLVITNCSIKASTHHFKNFHDCLRLELVVYAPWRPSMLCPSDLPCRVRDANLASRLLVVVKPVALREVDLIEWGVRFYTFCLPETLRKSQSVKAQRPRICVAYVWFKLYELEASTVHGDNVLLLGRALLRVDLRSFHDACAVLPLMQRGRLAWPDFAKRRSKLSSATNLAILTFPDEVGVATAALLLVLLLCFDLAFATQAMPTEHARSG